MPSLEDCSWSNRLPIYGSREGQFSAPAICGPTFCGDLFPQIADPHFAETKFESVNLAYSTVVYAFALNAKVSSRQAFMCDSSSLLKVRDSGAL